MKLTSFQDKCKVAKTKPLYEKGLKADPKTFRPFSLLPYISKIIERIINDQTINFLSNNNVIYTICIIKISFNRLLFVIPPWQNYERFQFWSPDWNGSYWFTKGVGYSWPQHFNKNMPFLGFTDETIKWCSSCLSNRKFVISMENAYSDKASITCSLLYKIQFWVHCSF